MGAVGVEGRLGGVCLDGLCVEAQGLVPLLVAEGRVALVLELGRLVWRAPHGVSIRWKAARAGASMRDSSSKRAIAEGATGVAAVRRGSSDGGEGGRGEAEKERLASNDAQPQLEAKT